MTKTFYAIYDVVSKKFKGRGNMNGVRWTEVPTQTYETESKAKAALKLHMKGWERYASVYQKREKYPIVIPVTVAWEDPKEILEGMFK